MKNIEKAFNNIFATLTFSVIMKQWTNDEDG